MQITDIKIQARNKNRVNVFVDGKFRFSLDVYQLTDLGIKNGAQISEDDLDTLIQEGEFSKVYARALEYCLSRPHSSREVKDYLYKKTLSSRDKNGILRPGINQKIIERVFNRLLDKKYIDDDRFAKFWIENRFRKKGISRRRLMLELKNKGVEDETIRLALDSSDRSDLDELRKVVAKKGDKYNDESKFIAYLARQGYKYDDIKNILTENDDRF